MILSYGIIDFGRGGRDVFLEECDNMKKSRLVDYDPDGIKYVVDSQKIL